MKAMIHTLMLDVRGTVLSAWEDAPMITELQDALGECLQNGTRLVLATATSLASTARGFVIEPLLNEFARRGIPPEVVQDCIAYLESGTVAYRFDLQEAITPLEGFDTLEFTETERRAADDVVQSTCDAYHRVEVRRKFKPGQVNCYVGGPWFERREIADKLNREFSRLNLERLVAQVPSARETIDVAVCTKERIARDYLRRTHVAPEQIAVVGDSLQTGGNDEIFTRALPGCKAFQVGELPPNISRCTLPGPRPCRRLGGYQAAR